MTLTLAIPTLTRYDLLGRAVASAAAEDALAPDTLVILDQRGGLGDLTKPLAALCAHRGTRLEVLTPARQISLAAAWNVFLKGYRDYLVIANDDVALHPTTLSSLVDAAEADPRGLVFVSPQHPLNEFSLFLIRRRARDVVGLFDEAFYPAYFEDGDYRHRLKLAGYEVVRVPGCTYGHDHSATLKAKSGLEVAAHWEAFARNRARYVEKWGGEPGQERYRTPFGEKAA